MNQQYDKQNHWQYSAQNHKRFYLYSPNWSACIKKTVEWYFYKNANKLEHIHWKEIATRKDGKPLQSLKKTILYLLIHSFTHLIH